MGKRRIYYLQWDPALYLSKTVWLSDDEDLMYRRMIDRYWIDKGLPNDPEMICKKIRFDKEKFDKCWPTVKDFFKVDPDDDSFLYHDKLDELFKNCVKKSQLSIKAVEERERKRKQKISDDRAIIKRSSNDCPNDHRAIIHTDTDTDTDIDTDIRKEKSKKKKSNSLASRKKKRHEYNEKRYPGFFKFWKSWPRKDNSKLEAYEIWVKEDLEQEATKIYEATEYRAIHVWGVSEEIKYLKHAVRWLKKRMWEDEVYNVKPKNNVPYDEQRLNAFLKDPIGSNGSLKMAKQAAWELNRQCEETVMRIVGHKLDETLENWNEETKQWIS